MCESKKVLDFLMRLDGTYKIVQSQILSIGPLPRLEKADAVAAPDEKQ